MKKHSPKSKPPAPQPPPHKALPAPTAVELHRASCADDLDQSQEEHVAGQVVESERLYQTADELELRDGVEEIWRDRPAVLFRDLCACAIMTIESVAVTHWEAERRETQEALIADLCPNVDRFRHMLAIAKAIWQSQYLCPYLTQPVAIRASKFGQPRGRFDGCCYHEVAIRFGEDLSGGIDAGRTTRYYAGLLRFHTAQGELVTDYLQSLRADIRCESQVGLDKWRAESKSSLVAANKANSTRLFPQGPPEDPDVRDVVLRLDSAKGTGKSNLDVAREFYSELAGKDPKSKKLLARIRMMRNRGQINL